jgi:predicted outer membrane lipoprotein
MLGSLLASGFHVLIKALEYETVEPEQDDEGEAGHHFNPATQQEKADPAFNPAEYTNTEANKGLTGNPTAQASAANMPGRGVRSRNAILDETAYGGCPSLDDGRTLTPRAS